MVENNFSFSSVASKAKVTYDVGLRSFMLGTYNYMALGVAFTGLVTLFFATNEALMKTLSFGPISLVILLALFALGFTAPRIIIGSRNIAFAHLAYWLYAGMVSVLISPLIYSFLNIEGGVMDIARAFFITAAMFGGTSLYGYTTRRNLQGMGGFLVMMIFGVIIASLVNIWFKSTGFSLILSYITVILFAVVTAYETQMLKMQYDAFYREGTGAVKRLGILGALMLYGSFINIFINILNIMALSRRS